MADETRTANIVDEISARPSLDATALLQLRNAVRNDINERKALQVRLHALENETLSRDEKTSATLLFNGFLDVWIKRRRRSKACLQPLAV